MTARTDFLRVRVRADETERWRNAAAAHGMSVSGWLRALADEAAATNRSGRETAAALAALRQDLARGIGNNLNQLAHRMNAGQPIEAGALDDAARDARAAMRDVERALRAVRPPKPRRAP